MIEKYVFYSYLQNSAEVYIERYSPFIKKKNNFNQYKMFISKILNARIVNKSQRGPAHKLLTLPLIIVRFNN